MTGHLVPLLTCDGCQDRQVPATRRDQTLPQYGDDYGYGYGYGYGTGSGSGNGW